MAKYKQCICGDRTAILKDGHAMTVEEILSELRNKTHYDLSTVEGREQQVIDNLPNEFKVKEC